MRLVTIAFSVLLAALAIWLSTRLVAWNALQACVAAGRTDCSGVDRR